MKKPALWLAVLVLLAAAQIYARQTHVMDAAVVAEYYAVLAPAAARFEPLNDHVALACGAAGEELGYVGVKANIGYGGPLLVGVALDPTGAMVELAVLDHKETPSYLLKLEQAGYFKQYEKMTAAAPLTLGYDLDAVSGATLSSRAIAAGVQDIAHTAAERGMGLQVQKAALTLALGLKEGAAALLFLLAGLGVRLKKLGRQRLPLLILSVAVLGFWLNRALSMGHISAAFLGYFPPPAENALWYIIVLGAPLLILFSGKNLYCTYVCPFCGLQELTHRLSRVGLTVPRLMKIARIGKKIILFAVVFIAFLTLNPSASNFDPFGAAFGLSGSSAAWYLLFVALVSSFFFHRYWCRAFCPVGTFLDLLTGFRREAARILRRQPPAGRRAAAEAEDALVKPLAGARGGDGWHKTDAAFALVYLLTLGLIVWVVAGG
ncbi:MAG: 4Fe-4S binding protein [Gracilibacteraceae bacterium]|jgi:Na+-translocating ferredoxin:NAD+ oxidoreductase RnfG subunit|nr:4Fe-4S binding protein [Gracilibacteraceae bacterium]